MGNDDQRLAQLSVPRRNKYFYGKLMDDFHFLMEQSYFNRKRWLLNRFSLGEGILFGLKVTVSTKKKELYVEPGVAVDPLGREIIVPETVKINPNEITDEFGHKVDSGPLNGIVYVCLAYRECVSDFLPALVDDCNTRDHCEPGTIIESFQLLVQQEEPGCSKKAKELGKLYEKLPELVDIDDPLKRREALFKIMSQTPPQVQQGNAIVPLAKVTLAKGLVTKVAACGYQTDLFSNSELLDLLLCLTDPSKLRGPQGETGPKGDPGPKGDTGDTGRMGDKGEKGEKGNPGDIGPQGPEGPPGQGLDFNLPAISEYRGWEHEGIVESEKFFAEGLSVQFNREIIKLPTDGNAWFIVTVEYPVRNALELSNDLIALAPSSSGFFPGTIVVHRILGEIGMEDKIAYFKPDPQYHNVFLNLVEVLKLDKALVRIVLKCNFLVSLDKEEQVVSVDGDYLQGKQASLPTGDGVPGGDFESWFYLYPTKL